MWASIIPAVLSLAQGLLSKKKAAPGVAYQPPNLQDEQKKAIEGNINAEDDIEQLLHRSNSFAQDEATSLMEKAMPGYGTLSKKLTDLSGELLTNPYSLPPDVQRDIERKAAERGISVGTQGQTREFSLLRDLGVNALEYGNSRINQAQSITSLLGSLAPKVNPMSPMSFYVTPAQTAQVATGAALANQEIAQGAANAGTASGNANNQSMWDSLSMAAARLLAGGSKSTGTIPKSTKSNTGDFGLGFDGGLDGAV